MNDCGGRATHASRAAHLPIWLVQVRAHLGQHSVARNAHTARQLCLLAHAPPDLLTHLASCKRVCVGWVGGGGLVGGPVCILQCELIFMGVWHAGACSLPPGRLQRGCTHIGHMRIHIHGNMAFLALALASLLKHLAARRDAHACPSVLHTHAAACPLMLVGAGHAGAASSATWPPAGGQTFFPTHTFSPTHTFHQHKPTVGLR